MCECVTFQVRFYSVHGSDRGEGKLYLRRDIPVLRGLRELNANHHGKVPAYSSVYILLYEDWQVFVSESCFKNIYEFQGCFCLQKIPLTMGARLRKI